MYSFISRSSDALFTLRLSILPFPCLLPFPFPLPPFRCPFFFSRIFFAFLCFYFTDGLYFSPLRHALFVLPFTAFHFYDLFIKLALSRYSWKGGLRGKNGRRYKQNKEPGNEILEKKIENSKGRGGEESRG